MGESDPYRELYLPLMLSMTLGQPGAYWDTRYAEELSRVNAAQVHMEEALSAQSAQQRSQDSGAGAGSGARHAVQVQTALDELYAWYGLPATVLSIASISTLSLAPTDPILDVGTGNGHVCELLRIAGRRNLTGTDASARAIELANSVRALRALDEGPELQGARIAFQVDDILNSALITASFALIIDKGTLDSIAMCPSPSGAPVKNEVLFARQIHRLLRPVGFFLILSCNHDVEELTSIMGPAGLRVHRDFSSQVALVDPDLTLLCFVKSATSLEAD